MINLGGSDWRRMVGRGETKGRGLRVSGSREGGGKKKLVGRIFSKVILIDALLGGCIEEWIGIGLRVGMGVY